MNGEKSQHRFNRRSFLKTVGLAMAGTAVASRGVGAVTQPGDDSELNKDELQKLSVQDIQSLENGVKFDLGTNVAYVRLFDADLAKISILEAGESEFESPGIAKTADEWETPQFTRNDGPNRYTLETDAITIEVKKQPFGIKFLDADGNVINEDYLDYGTAGYENGKPYVFKETTDNESFYGFGEQGGLNLDQRGESLGLWNTDAYSYGLDTKYLYTAIPFFVGLKEERAYGLFFDNTYRSYYEMASESDDYYYFYANGGKLTYYFTYGPDIGDVIDRYTELTGKMDVPAKWTLGLHQSKWQYTPDQILNIARTYREKDIPLDTMHFDIDYMRDFRVFTWDDEYKQALGELKSMEGFHAIAINDPAVKQDPGYEVYEEGTENDYWAKNPDGSTYIGEVWPGDSAFPDFLQEDVRNWWSDNHEVLFDAGVDGVWNDMNEPAVFDGPFHTMPLDIVFGDGPDTKLHKEYHNLYGHDETSATYDAFGMHKPDERPFVLTRDMYAGTQRYAALWTGDNVSSWEHLQMSLPMNMNVGLSGVSFVGNDIGGFAQRPDAELFGRWIEVGAFLPFSRIHYDSNAKADGGSQRQEPWAFGEEVEAISKKYIEMRYRLLPYLYTEFKEAAESGKPVQQPLVYQFQDDERTYDIADQFMFGDALMLAPVVEQGQTSREVYLPDGVRWTDYWTGTEYEGGQTLSVDAPLEHLPIFVKRDSMIPMREVQQYTDENPLTTLELDTYLDEEATYSFYEDDGETPNYKDGEYNVTNFSVSASNGDVVTFEREIEVENYDESQLSSYLLKLDRSEAPRKVQAASSKYEPVDAETVEDTPETFTYDADEDAVFVHIPADEDGKVKLFFNGHGRGHE
jgi:alpha-glucosidase